MGNITCYDAVGIMLDEATKQFSPVFKEDSEKKRKFERYCDWITLISDGFGGEAYDIEIDDVTMDISIALTCKEIETSKQTPVFYMLLSKAKNVELTAVDDTYIKISLVFPGIWVQA